MAVAAPRLAVPSFHILPFPQSREEEARLGDRFEARARKREARSASALDEPVKREAAEKQELPAFPLGLHTREKGGFGGGGEEGGGFGGEGEGEGGGISGEGGGESEPAPVDGPEGQSEGGTSVYDGDGEEDQNNDDEGATLGSPTSSTPWVYYPYPAIFQGWHNNPQPTVAPNATSAGKDIGETAFTDSSNNGTQEYAIYGDGNSLSDVWPKIQADCNAAPVAAWQMIPNNTLQSYRNATFAFLRENGTAPAINSTFEACVNNTIGHNLPMRGAASGYGVQGAAFMLPLVAVAFILRG